MHALALLSTQQQQQVATVLLAKGRITALSLRIRLAISTAQASLGFLAIAFYTLNTICNVKV